MGLLDKITSTVRNTVSSATNVAKNVVNTVKDDAVAVAHKADEYAGVIKDKAKEVASLATPGEKAFFSGISNAFQHTTESIAGTVNSTVQAVEGSVDRAAHSVVDAGAALQKAGQQVFDSGASIVKAGEKAVVDVAHIAGDAGRIVTDAGTVVVDAGRAAYHAGNAALTGDPRELDAANSAIRHARTEVRDAHDRVTDAQRQVADIGQQGERVAKAVGDAKDALENARTKLDAAAGSVGDAIHTMVNAPRDIMHGVETAIAQGGEEVRSTIEKTVPGGKQMLAGIDKYASGAKDVLMGVATNDPFRIGRGLKDEAKGMVDFGKGAWQAGSPIVDYAKQKILDYAQGFNVEKQVKDLKPGESYEFKVGANVHVEVGGEVKGSFKAERNKDGTYDITVGGQAGINGYLEAGGKLGPLKASAEASAHGLLGGNLTLKCDTPEEAQRAAQIMEKLAAKAGGAMAAGPAGLLLGPSISKDDVAFLKEHATGLELSGSVGVEAAAALGLTKGPLTLGAGLDAGLSQTTTVRLDLEKGKPTGVTVKQEFEGEIGADAGLGIKLGGDKKPEAPKPGEKPEVDFVRYMPVMSGKLTATVEVEQHFDFPKDVSAKEINADPLAAIKKYGKEMADTQDVTLKASLEGEGVLGPKRGNFSAEVEFKGKPAEVLNQDAIKKILGGDYAGAAREMGKGVEVEGSVKTVDVKKWGMEDFEIDAFGVGLGATFAAEKRHDNPPMIEFKGNGEELVSSLKLPKPENLRARAMIRG